MTYDPETVWKCLECGIEHFQRDSVIATARGWVCVDRAACRTRGGDPK